MKIALFVLLFGLAAEARDFECHSARTGSEGAPALKGVIDPSGKSIGNFEFFSPELTIFAIRNSRHTPNATSSFLYPFPLRFVRQEDLNEPGFEDAKRYLGPIHATYFNSKGEGTGVVLENVMTQFMIPATEINNTSFKAHIGFREHFDDWASDKLMFGMNLVCIFK